MSKTLKGNQKLACHLYRRKTFELRTWHSVSELERDVTDIMHDSCATVHELFPITKNGLIFPQVKWRIYLPILQNKDSYSLVAVES